MTEMREADYDGNDKKADYDEKQMIMMETGRAQRRQEPSGQLFFGAEECGSFHFPATLPHVDLE